MMGMFFPNIGNIGPVAIRWRPSAWRFACPGVAVAATRPERR